VDEGYGTFDPAVRVRGHLIALKTLDTYTHTQKRTDLVIHDAAVGFHQGFGVEGRLSVEHLVHAHAQRPPVTFRAVASLAVLHRLETNIAHIDTRPKKEKNKTKKLRKNTKIPLETPKENCQCQIKCSADAHTHTHKTARMQRYKKKKTGEMCTK
jgi:hypothetical protein